MQPWANTIRQYVQCEGPPDPNADFRQVDSYQRAVQLDQYLAVAYFQQGVSNFLMGDFEEALANFNDTLLYLRGNSYIDYDQLGLKFKLHSCEVLFNRGLCYIYLQQKKAGMDDLQFAAKEKTVPDHSVIDEAIREQAEASPVVLPIERCADDVFRATQSFPYQLASSIDPTRPRSRISRPKTILAKLD